MNTIPSWSIAPRGSYGEVRLLKKTQCVQRFVPLPASQNLMTDLLAEVAAKSQQGWNVYYGLNPRVRRRGRNGDVAFCTGFWIDIDVARGRNSLEDLARRKLQPSAVVFSGHGLHLYWFLHNVAFTKDSVPVARGLCTIVGCDPVWSPAATPRLPGTVNWKDPRRPVNVVLFEMSTLKYTLSELRSKLTGALSRPPPPGPVRRNGASSLAQPFPFSVVEALQMPEALRKVLRSYDFLDRSRADAALAIWAVESGWGDEQIESLLVTPLRSKSVERQHVSGLEAARTYLDRTISWARRTANRRATTGGRAIAQA